MLLSVPGLAYIVQSHFASTVGIEIPLQKPLLAQTNLQLFKQLAAAGGDTEQIAAFRLDYQNAALLLGGRIRSSGKPFLCHLVGTASALMMEGASFSTVRAGLLHASYTHGRFEDGKSGASGRHRQWLTARIGQDVEAVVYAYSKFKRKKQSVATIIDGSFRPEGETKNLFLMRLCNEVDDALDHGTVLGGKDRYKDKEWLRKLEAASAILGFGWCAKAFRFIAVEDMSCEWLAAQSVLQHWPHEIHTVEK